MFPCLHPASGWVPLFQKVTQIAAGMRAPLGEILKDLYHNGTAQWWERQKGEALIPPLERELYGAGTDVDAGMNM